METLVKTASQLTDYSSVRDFLYGLRYHGAKYGLDRMFTFSELMGNPHLNYPLLHIAGTNGKGSTCAMLEQIIRDQGWKTGLYTSPHLVRQGERIQVNRTILSEDEIVRMTREIVETLIQDAGAKLDAWPSFFEFMTMMAFQRFAECHVDVAVIETGLGGRLDATNIIVPDVSVITSISLDHTQILGDTIEKIAAEKAGIIKKGVPIVLGRMPKQAETVIRVKAALFEAPVFSIAERWGSDLNDYPESNLCGEYQKINGAISLLTCEILNRFYPECYHLDLERAKESLNHVYWPGRWERIKLEKKPLAKVILDASHNEEGSRMLELNLQQLIGACGLKPVIAVGSLGEDRAKSLMDVVSRYADTIYLLHPNQPRALSFEQLRSCIPRHFNGEIINANVSDLFEYHDIKLSLKPEQPLVVTGSIYLIGEVSDLLKCTPIVNQQSLQDVV